MKRLVVAAKARGYLKAIARYSAREWGAARAKKCLVAIRERFRLLCRQPEIGIGRADLAPGYRSFLVGRHVIFYRVEPGSVVVIRVLHQRMDTRLHINIP